MIGKKMISLKTLWTHQRESVERIRRQESPRRLLAFEMGCGKTRTAATAIADHAERLNGRGYVFVVAPKAVVGVWFDELSRPAYSETLAPHLIDSRYRRSDSDRRVDWFASRVAESNCLGRVAVFILNYEMINAGRTKTSKSQAAFEFSQLRPPSGIVYDESHWLANAKSRRSKTAVRIVDVMGPRSLVLCLSGTPFTSSPLSVFTQVRLIDPTVFGKSYFVFEKRHAIYQTVYIAGGKAIKKPTGAVIDNDRIREGFHSVADVVKCADVQSDLPEVVEQVYRFDLSSMSSYRKLERELIAEIDGGIVTIDNALQKFLRLRQLTAGIVKTDDSDATTVDNSRESALAELVDMIRPTTEQPLVVFYEFVEESRQIERVATERGLRYGEISGQNKEALDETTGRMMSSYDIVGVQVNTGTTGIDLTRSSVAIFYRHPVRGHHVFDQAIKRLHRPGQRSTVRVLHLIANETLDEKIYDAIQTQQSVAQKLLTIGDK
jgi:SNF2 family DNA or RNA helicase